MSRHRVAVEVATVWSDPDAPREIDSPALADTPDLAAWMAVLTVDERIGLHGRCETQLLLGEPVEIVTEFDNWVRIAAPWQPSPEDPRGYPGWVRRSHLCDTVSTPGTPAGRIGRSAPDVLAYAREFIGLDYLWGSCGGTYFCVLRTHMH